METTYMRSQLESLNPIKLNQLVRNISAQPVTWVLGHFLNDGQASFAMLADISQIGTDSLMLGFAIPSVNEDRLKELIQNKYFSINGILISSERNYVDDSKNESKSYQLQSSKLYPIPYLSDAVIKIALEFDERLNVSSKSILITGKVNKIVIDNEYKIGQKHISLSSYDMPAASSSLHMSQQYSVARF
jgi:hypothetical protein